MPITAKMELVLKIGSDPYSDTVRPGTKIPNGMTEGGSDGSDFIVGCCKHHVPAGTVGAAVILLRIFVMACR